MRRHMLMDAAWPCSCGLHAPDVWIFCKKGQRRNSRTENLKTQKHKTKKTKKIRIMYISTLLRNIVALCATYARLGQKYKNATTADAKRNWHSISSFMQTPPSWILHFLCNKMRIQLCKNIAFKTDVFKAELQCFFSFAYHNKHVAPNAYAIDITKKCNL